MYGRARASKRTKDLLTCLLPGEFALIQHEDLDDATAQDLIDRGVGAVLNTAPFISGRYPVTGARRLLARGVYLLENLGVGLMDAVRDGELLELRGDEVWRDGIPLARGARLNAQRVMEREAEAQRRLPSCLRSFVGNTLERALREQELVLSPFPLPPLHTSLRRRAAVVVSRGADYRDDLLALAPFIKSARPALIAVDGGADALRAYGWHPDLIVGDMDSVSDEALLDGAEIIAHAYADGRSPALERIRALDLEAHVIPMTGTSEDLALLLAYEAGAEPIVTVGSHRGLVDFMEKGRPGMASTLLVRFKLSHVLIDARGISRLRLSQTDAKCDERSQLGRVVSLRGQGSQSGARANAREAVPVQWR